MRRLAELIAQPSARTDAVDPFFAGFGLRRNPFPTARTIIPDVIYNQTQAIEAFAARVSDILGPKEPQKRSMAILGGTGSGKTRFMRHCQWLLRDYDDARRTVVVEFLAGTSYVQNLLNEILRSADDLCKNNGEADLLSAMVNEITSEEDLQFFSFHELRRVISLLSASKKSGFRPPDRDRRIGFDQIRELAAKWISGATLTATEKKYLNVFSRLPTASILARVVTEILSFAWQKSIIDGVVVCLDEIESLFTGQNSTAKIQQFLQDLRVFFDEAVKGQRGFSLLVVSGWRCAPTEFQLSALSKVRI